MQLHQLSIENFKRVQAATIRFPEGGGAFEICGRNAQGKTTCIDAIWAALGGAKAAPDRPIRDGARAASIEVKLDGLRVRREWDGRGSRLVVTDADGCRLGSPQTLLDSLYERLAFDPLEFSRLAPAKQAETLRRLAGLDFTEIDRRRQAAYDERTQVHRALKQQQAQLDAMGQVEPADEVSMAELTVSLRQATQHNARVERDSSAVNQKAYQVRQYGSEIATAEDQIRELTARVERLRDCREQAQAELEAMRAALPQTIDPQPILDAIADAEATNRRARAWKERHAALEILQANRAHAEDLGDHLAMIDRQKAETLAAARMPIDGLGLDGDAVTLRGIPFAQLSSAEQVRVSLAMAGALNPTLRLIVIREGSLLDESSLRLVAAWAESNGYQVLIERVADATIGAGVVIEEGRVKAAEPTEAEPSLF